MNIMKKWVQNDQFVRFVIVGIIATIIQYGVYCLLLLLLPHNLAYTIGYIVSFLVNYLLTTSFTFKAVRSLYSGIGFGVCHVINYLMHIGLLNFFIFMGLPKAVAPIPVLCICVPTNFFLVKFVMVKFIRR